jgi:hypothetical protein
VTVVGEVAVGKWGSDDHDDIFAVEFGAVVPAFHVEVFGLPHRISSLGFGGSHGSFEGIVLHEALSLLQFVFLVATLDILG